MKKLQLLAAICVIAACQDTTSPTAKSLDHANTLVSIQESVGASVPESYIVTLRDNVPDIAGTTRGLIALRGGVLKHVYQRAMKGFAVTG